MTINQLEEYKSEVLERLYNTNDPKEEQRLLQQVEDIEREIQSNY